MGTENETTDLVRMEPSDLMWSSSGFDYVQRVAKLFAASELIPPHLRGKVPDVSIALMMARRLDEDPLVIMQSIYVVSGKAGWSAQYIIGRANRSGVFKGRINWRESGTCGQPDYAVTAFATLADTGEEVAFTVSMDMARKEVWTKNAKYQSMPALMLRYRSATILVRLYAPEVMLGIPTSDELEDITQSAQVIRAATAVPSSVPVAPSTTAPAPEDDPPPPSPPRGLRERLATAAAPPASAASSVTVSSSPTSSPSQSATSALGGGGSAADPKPQTNGAPPQERDTRRRDLAAECRALEGRCRTIPALVGMGAEIREACGAPPIGAVSGLWSLDALTRYRAALQDEITRASSPTPDAMADPGGSAADAAQEEPVGPPPGAATASPAMTPAELAQRIQAAEERLGWSDQGIAEAREDVMVECADSRLHLSDPARLARYLTQLREAEMARGAR